MALETQKDASLSLSDLISYDNLIHATAGASGGVVAMSLVYPLDVVRTRLQVDDSFKAMGPFQGMKKLSEEEGIDTLYRGLGPVLTSLCASNFVYFYSFNGMKRIGDICGVKASPMRDLIFGYLSGCINALITTPLWVANTRLKLQVSKPEKNEDENKEKKKHLKGLVDGLVTIAKQDGICALWHGVSTSFILAGNPAIHFMVYETLKRIFLKSKRAHGKVEQLSSIESFVLGGLAKCVATVVTYPLQLVQVRQRAARKSGGTAKTAMSDIIQDVLKTSGMSGLYKGMETKLYQTVFAAAIMFLTYEKVVRTVHRVFKSRV